MNAAIETIIVPRTRDLGGGFEVRRVLPSAERRTVGPFVFFDQLGPTVLAAGTGLDVRPHPHIGLATVTYLFDGEILHRDSLGTVQPIRPGEVNWMTAGRGIVHSERTPPELRTGGARLFGIQTWVGLPRDREEAEPAFAHHAEGALPLLDGEGKRVRVIAGALDGARSPVAVLSETLYADAALADGARLELPAEYEERAVYIAEGRIAIGAETFAAGRMLVFRHGDRVADGPARLLLLGGAPLDGPRHLWWNFVSSSAGRIEQAKADWREGRFPKVPGRRGSSRYPRADRHHPQIAKFMRQIVSRKEDRRRDGDYNSRESICCRFAVGGVVSNITDNLSLLRPGSPLDGNAQTAIVEQIA